MVPHSHALARRLQEEEDNRAPDVADLGYQQPGRHPAQYQGRSHAASGSASPGRSGPAHGSAASGRERKKDNVSMTLCLTKSHRFYHNTIAVDNYS